MINSKNLIIVLILSLGFFYKILITSNGNFIFNIDNARDMIDVREMVNLHKLRLIGPTSGIEGFYNGPFWYYLLSIPFILSGGNPYAAVLLMILFWIMGGFFVLKISSRWGILPMLLVGILWLSSNYVTLATIYSFNPNPVLLLTPVLIYFLEKYLNKNSIYLSLAVWFLAGLFFQFEMAFGLFTPLIIVFALIFSGKLSYLKSKSSFFGIGVFALMLIPQILFNFRHQSLFFTSLVNHFSKGDSQISDIPRYLKITNLYFDTISATLINSRILTQLFILSFIILLIILAKFKSFKKDKLLIILISFLLIPFVGSIFIPLNFLPWHLGGTMASVILLVGFLTYKLQKNPLFKILAAAFSVIIILYGIKNLELGKHLAHSDKSDDPSVLQNETAAIDYVYNFSGGKNFKVYTFLPSVYDYPYQYLFWWYGQNKYGYLPKEYAYLPNKPTYISNKEAFNYGKIPPDSNLVFLIKEPNRPDLQSLWENNFTSLPMIQKTKVATLEVEVRNDKK